VGTEFRLTIGIGIVIAAVADVGTAALLTGGCSPGTIGTVDTFGIEFRLTFVGTGIVISVVADFGKALTTGVGTTGRYPSS